MNHGGVLSLDELEARLKGNNHAETDTAAITATPATNNDSRAEDTVNKRVVFKCGRTTGKTRGEMNNIYADVRMRYAVDGGDILTVQGKTLVVVSPAATSRRWGPANGCPVVFGDYGDSGSLVFDYQGKTIGTYIGGQDTLRACAVNPHIKASSIDGVHFVTPIGPTLDSVHATLRRDPVFAGYDRVEVELM